MPRRWHQVLKKLTLLGDDGDKKARSPGRARNKPLKPFAQGVPDRFGGPVVTISCAFLFRTRGCGCDRAPGIPCALFIEGRCRQNSRVSRGEIAKPWLFEILNLRVKSRSSPLPLWERSDRSWRCESIVQCDPGEGYSFQRDTITPHPNPLPLGERERTAAVGISRQNSEPRSIGPPFAGTTLKNNA
jgi:hypothetical protein